MPNSIPMINVSRPGGIQQCGAKSEAAILIFLTARNSGSCMDAYQKDYTTTWIGGT